MTESFGDSLWKCTWRTPCGTGVTETFENPLFRNMSSDLNAAASEGNLPRVQALLQEWDPAFNPSQTLDNLEPFWESLEIAVTNDHLHVVVYLLDHGFSCSEYAVSEAIKKCSIPMLQAFMEHGWDVNEGGPTVLRPALRHLLDDEEMRKWLLSHGADPNIENKHGVTPLETAVIYEDISIVEELLKHGGQPLRDNSLQYAAGVGDNKKIELLLEAGADINMLEHAHKKYMPQRPLRTALHSAIYNQRPELIEFLLKKGADIEVLNNLGQTALECAESWGLDKMAELIRNTRLQ